MRTGIAVGKEESDFKEFDNFTLFTERLKSTGVDAVLAGPVSAFYFYSILSASKFVFTAERYTVMHTSTSKCVTNNLIINSFIQLNHHHRHHPKK